MWFTLRFLWLNIDIMWMHIDVQYLLHWCYIPPKLRLTSQHDKDHSLLQGHEHRIKGQTFPFTDKRRYLYEYKCILFSSKIFDHMEHLRITTAVAQLVQHPTCVQKVVCSNSVLDRPMHFKQVVTVPPPNAWQRNLGGDCIYVPCHRWFCTLRPSPSLTIRNDLISNPS